jgi:hypothetical protein
LLCSKAEKRVPAAPIPTTAEGGGSHADAA